MNGHSQFRRIIESLIVIAQMDSLFTTHYLFKYISGNFGSRKWRLEFVRIDDLGKGRFYKFPCKEKLRIPRDKQESVTELSVLLH